MKSAKSSGILRPLSFLVIAAILIGTISFAAVGMQAPDNKDLTDTDDNIIKDTESKDETNNKEEINIPSEPEVYIPKYINHLTGLEVTEAESRLKPLCIVNSSNSPLYGISSSGIIFEFPIEDGTTRLLSYQTNISTIGKIGSISATRGYISNFANYFGGCLVSYGNDDTVVYDSFDDKIEHFDLKAQSGYHYTEHNQFVYSNGDLLNAGLTNSNISTALMDVKELPFVFNVFGNEDVSFEKSAESVFIPYSEASTTELMFSDADMKYTLSVNGAVKKDMLNNKSTSFDNVFIIFCDSITYESAKSTELVMDTVTGGEGLYITRGTSCNIFWSTDDVGNLIFTDENGDELIINRGTSYFGIVKSSEINTIVIS